MGRLPMNGFDLNKLIICSSHIIRHDLWNITKKNIWISICSPLLPFLSGVELLAVALCSGFKMNPLGRQIPDSQIPDALFDCRCWLLTDHERPATWKSGQFNLHGFKSHVFTLMQKEGWRLLTADCRLPTEDSPLTIQPLACNRLPSVFW